MFNPPNTLAFFLLDRRTRDSDERFEEIADAVSRFLTSHAPPWMLESRDQRTIQSYVREFHGGGLRQRMLAKGDAAFVLFCTFAVAIEGLARDERSDLEWLKGRLDDEFAALASQRFAERPQEGAIQQAIGGLRLSSDQRQIVVAWANRRLNLIGVRGAGSRKKKTLARRRKA